MFKVIPLFEGYSETLDNNTMRANCSCTLIKGEKSIIVDTMTAWDRDRLIKAFVEQNITPDKIDFVVCTHTHPDHTGNNNLFLNAEHIIGHCIHRSEYFYEKNFPCENYEPSPGIKIISTPGHSFEDITVLVETKVDQKSTCYAITGDLFEKKEDISDPAIWKKLGNPKLVKVQSEMRFHIIKLADFIIPGHGPMFAVTDDMRKLVEEQVII